MRKTLTPKLRKKTELRPFEVLTVYSHSGVAGQHIGRRIVIATSTSKAATIPLRDGEEIVHAREMVDYELVIMR